MNGRSLLGWLTLAILAVLLSACFTTASRQVYQMKTEIEAELPGAEFEKEFALTLGRLSLGLAKGIANMALDEEDQEDLRILRGLKKVEIGVYEASYVPEIGAEVAARVEAMMARKDWVAAVKVREGDSLSWVYYRLDDEAIRGIFVIVLDRHELALVRLKGRIDRMLAAAIHISQDPDDSGLI